MPRPIKLYPAPRAKQQMLTRCANAVYAHAVALREYGADSSEAHAKQVAAAEAFQRAEKYRITALDREIAMRVGALMYFTGLRTPHHRRIWWQQAEQQLRREIEA